MKMDVNFKTTGDRYVQLFDEPPKPHHMETISIVRNGSAYGQPDQRYALVPELHLSEQLHLTRMHRPLPPLHSSLHPRFHRAYSRQAPTAGKDIIAYSSIASDPSHSTVYIAGPVLRQSS